MAEHICMVGVWVCHHLCRVMRQLDGHQSCAYVGLDVSNGLPHLLPAGDSNKLTAAQLVDHVLTVDRNTAAAEVTKIMSRLNFVSTYGFSKLLTEQLVDDPDTLPGIAKVIIRPSLISPMAGAPYPG